MCYTPNVIFPVRLTFPFMEARINREQKALGQRLRQLRIDRKLSQLDIEVATGIANADISRIENGKTNVELVTLVKLAIAFNIELMELFNYNDIPLK